MFRVISVICNVEGLVASNNSRISTIRRYYSLIVKTYSDFDAPIFICDCVMYRRVFYTGNTIFYYIVLPIDH